MSVKSKIACNDCYARSIVRNAPEAFIRLRHAGEITYLCHPCYQVALSEAGPGIRVIHHGDCFGFEDIEFVREPAAL